MIIGVKRFLEIKENTSCTFAIIEGISYVFKHDQQSHICGVIVSKAKLILFVMSHSSRKLSNLLYMSLSSIFENIGSREIGL